MPRFINTKKETVGLSPDAIHFRGLKKTDKSKLSLINFTQKNLFEKTINSISDVKKYCKEDATTWLNIDGLDDMVLMQDIADQFQIETIAISDLLNTDGRPKLHEYENCLFISLKMLQFDENTSKILADNFSLILKNKIVITFQEKTGDVFNPVRSRIRQNKKRIRNSGTDYLAVALIDVIIDNYMFIISRLGEKIETLDQKLITSTSKMILDEINRFKSEIIFLRKTIKPAREMVLKLTKLDSEFMNDYMNVHLTDLQNNIDMANETVDSYREMLTELLNIYHTKTTDRLNETLKFLTIFSVIFIPVTFIVGVYGTNFDNIPELHLKYGYFYMWITILVVVLIMIIYFKRKKWM